MVVSIQLSCVQTHPSRRSWWVIIIFSWCVENKVSSHLFASFSFLFFLKILTSLPPIYSGKILPWQQRRGCRRAPCAGNGSVKRGSLLLCMKGAGNKNMHECSPLLANLSRPKPAGPSQAPSGPLINAKTGPLLPRNVSELLLHKNTRSENK